MAASEFDPQWAELFTEIQAEMRQWRREHPKATMRQIELATEQCLARLAARMVGDIAAASDAAFFSDRPPGTRPHCPRCDVPVDPHGAKGRRLRAHGEQHVPLEREHAVCPQCGEAFFPPR